MEHFSEKTFSNIEKSPQSWNILIFAIFVAYYNMWPGDTNQLSQLGRYQWQFDNVVILEFRAPFQSYNLQKIQII